MVVSVLDTVTSLISGLVIFSILGAMAHDLNIPIELVVKDGKYEWFFWIFVVEGVELTIIFFIEGPGLAFVAYPEALSRLPVPQLWSVLFFLMLFILGLDSEVCIPKWIILDA